MFNDIKIYKDIMDFLKINHDKTILLGYTKKNEALHLYTKDNYLILHTYNIEYSLDIKIKNIHTGNGDIITLTNIIPTRYIYPECSSWDFLELLKKYTTNFNIAKYIPIEKKQYYGEVFKKNVLSSYIKS